MATREELGKIARQNVGKSLIDLEPSSIIELYELYFDVDQEPFRFHAGTNDIFKNIIWNNNDYYASAIEVEGFEANIVGRLPRPKITVANVDYTISNILRDFSDFRNGKFIRVRLFLKHLDAINFENSENPFGTPDPLAYISQERYLISQKIVENKQIIQFELITPFDLESLETATRSIYGRYCYWQYRGAGCGYQGDLICKEDDSDFSISPSSASHLRNSVNQFVNQTYEDTIKNFKWSLDKNYSAGDIVFIENADFNGFKDPPRTFFVCIKSHSSSKFITPDKSYEFWEKDGCSKTIKACKKRFLNSPYVSFLGYAAYNDSDVVNNIMPFGGFPGTDKFQYQ